MLESENSSGFKEAKSLSQHKIGQIYIGWAETLITIETVEQGVEVLKNHLNYILNMRMEQRLTLVPCTQSI